MPRHIAEDGCRIHYDARGTAGPRVLLLPGLGGDARFWTGVAAGLAEDHRVIATDHRGAGRSDRPEGAYTLDRIARDVRGLIAAQDGPVHLVGHSTGGAVAQMLAIDPPANLASVTISCSWARSDARFRAIFGARAALLDAGSSEAYQALTDVFGHTAGYLETHEDALREGRRTAAEKLAPLAVTAATGSRRRGFGCCSTTIASTICPASPCPRLCWRRRTISCSRRRCRAGSPWPSPVPACRSCPARISTRPPIRGR